MDEPTLPEKGKTYALHHSRFGRATVRVESVSEEWADTTVVSGYLRGMRDEWGPGDVKTVRLSHCLAWKEVA
jgi:hypothetical protein